MTDFPLWWGINIPPYGNILAAVFPFLLGYSILKYKLFNVRAIISEILVFFIAVVLLIEAILSTSIAETIIKFSVFIIVSVFGYILIRSVYREVSQREKIQLLATDLQTANDAQVNLIHIMNHQIKGRFSDARSAFAMLLEGEYGVISEEAKVILQKGLEQTEIGVDYVQGILKGLSATNGTLPYDMKDLDLKALIKSVTDRLASKATEKKLKFEVNLADGDFKINGDGIQLSEVVGNLINNSIAYTPAGSIHVWLTKKGNKALVAVQDTGVGITEEDKLKLFKTGGRGKDSIKVNINSTGYGLSFVKGVVEAHKGRVWAESDGPGKGSSFYMEVSLIG
jgi:signal transduction histidine kinase